MTHRTIWLDAQFTAVQNDGDDLSITVEDVTLVLSGDLSSFLSRVMDAVRLAEEPGEDDNTRECSRCGEGVSILNSQDECAGCEEERAQRKVCISCDETIPDGEQGFRWADQCQICSGCAHDAYRSGWSGDDVNSKHPHGF